MVLTAAVAAGAPGSGAPSGQVNFFDATTSSNLGTAPLSGGQATLSLSSLPAGNQAIVATYSGDTNFMSSMVGLTQTVSATPLLENGVLAIPGNATSAAYTLTPTLPSGASAYSMKVTRTIGTTTTNLGTFAVPSGILEVYGGPATSAVTLSGTASYDAFAVGNGGVSEQAAQGARRRQVSLWG